MIIKTARKSVLRLYGGMLWRYWMRGRSGFASISSVGAFVLPGHGMLAVDGRFYNPASVFLSSAAEKPAEKWLKRREDFAAIDSYRWLIIDKSADFNTAVIKVVAAGLPSDSRGEQAVKEMLSLKDRYKIDEYDTVIC
jgi:hypothetical protein